MESTLEFLEKHKLLEQYSRLHQKSDIDQTYEKYLDGIAGVASYVPDQSLTTLLNNPPQQQQIDKIDMKFDFTAIDPTVKDTHLGLDFSTPENIEPPKLNKKIILKLKMSDADKSIEPFSESPKKRKKRSASSDGENKRKRKSIKK